MRKDRAKNLLLLCSAIVVGYAVFDFLVWRTLLQLVPLKLHPELGRLQILAQSSKQGIVPRDYILMIGDSYAEGLGDWRMEVGGEGNPDFHSAHLLFNRIGRDLVTFGIRGGNPTFAFVYNATRAFEGLQLYATYDIEPPKDVLAFFYEGNDIADEIAGIRDLPGDFERSRLTGGDYYYRNLIFKAGQGRQKKSEPTLALPAQRASLRHLHQARQIHGKIGPLGLDVPDRQISTQLVALPKHAEFHPRWR